MVGATRPEHEPRAARVPEGPAREPARCDVGVRLAFPWQRRRRRSLTLERHQPAGPRPDRGRRLRIARRPFGPEPAGDPRLARGGALLGRRPCALARARQDDRHRLPRRPARHAAPRRAARADRDDHAHDRRLQPRPRDTRALAVHRPRPALPVAEPRLGPARRRHRRVGAALALAAQPPAPPPSPPPRRGRHELPLAARRRRLGRAAALPVGARRPARGDLAAPGRLRAAADPRLQRGARAHDHRHRPRRGPGPDGLPPRVASKAGWCGSCPPPAHSSSSRRGSP